MSDKPTKKQLALRKKWVKALRSGRFEQCSRRLFDGTGYCCLGVACRVLGMKPRGRMFGDEKLTLPASAQRLLGLGELGQEDRSKGFGYTSDLTLLNDRGRSFEHIAAVIERELIKPYES